MPERWEHERRSGDLTGKIGAMQHKKQQLVVERDMARHEEHMISTAQYQSGRWSPYKTPEPSPIPVAIPNYDESVVVDYTTNYHGQPRNEYGVLING